MIIIQDCEVMGLRKAIHGMRNPLNSWDKSDSKELFCLETDIECCNCPYEYEGCDRNPYKKLFIGPADMKLAKSLIKAGSSDRKFLRMIHVQFDVLAPLYWWKEADQYKIGTTTNSCSTMHKIHDKKFKLDDFSFDNLDCVTRPLFDDGNLIKDDGTCGTYNCSAFDFLQITCDVLNKYRDLYLATNNKKYWWQIIQLLPSSYNQMRTWDLDYETLLNIYFQRRNHKLDEWHTFCNWIISLPYMKEFISVLDKKEESNE